jgi:hypothetical protein
MVKKYTKLPAPKMTLSEKYKSAVKKLFSLAH